MSVSQPRSIVVGSGIISQLLLWQSNLQFRWDGGFILCWENVVCLCDQKRIPRVVITSFLFHSLWKTIFKTAELPSLVWCRFFLFLSYLFLISPCPHSRVYLQYRTIVQINSQTRRSNSSQFSWLWSSKTITSTLLLSVVLLKAIHAMTFRTKFLLFVSICVPPNNPITDCGATSFPGYHSFPKWAIHFIHNYIWTLSAFPCGRTQHVRCMRCSTASMIQSIHTCDTTLSS